MLGHFFTILFSLLNFEFARLLQGLLLKVAPTMSYTSSLVAPWFLITLPLVFKNPEQFGLILRVQRLKEFWKKIAFYSLIVVAGLLLFYFTGITKYFHNQAHLLLFFLFVPVIEEAIFRGWVYGKLEILSLYPVLGSSLLFGLHHLQYYNFALTPFALFQVAYTFALGLLLGKIREFSGSVYLGIFLHILINFLVTKI